MSVKISLTTLKKQVEDGMKKGQLAEYYGMSELQVGKLLKQAGLKIRKFHKPVFELVMDELEPVVTEVETQPIAGVLEEEPMKEYWGMTASVAEEPNLFGETVEEPEEFINFEASSVKTSIETPEDEDPLLNELLK